MTVCVCVSMGSQSFALHCDLCRQQNSGCNHFLSASIPTSCRVTSFVQRASPLSIRRNIHSTVRKPDSTLAPHSVPVPTGLYLCRPLALNPRRASIPFPCNLAKLPRLMELESHVGWSPAPDPIAELRWHIRRPRLSFPVHPPRSFTCCG